MSPVGSSDRRAADAALHAASHAAGFAERRAGAGAHAAFRHRRIGGRPRRLIAAVGARTNAPVADRQVEDRRRRDDRHVCGSEREADPFLLEVPHDAGRRIEAERAAARQDDGVGDLDEVDGIEQIGFARRRSRAAHVHAGRDAGFGQHDRAAGRALGERVMADLDARNRRQRGVLTRAGRLDRRRRRSSR